MFSYILSLKWFVLAFERSIWISHTGEMIMLCFVLGERRVKEESEIKSEMMQELGLINQWWQLKGRSFGKTLAVSQADERSNQQNLRDRFFAEEELALIFQSRKCLRVGRLGDRSQWEWTISIRKSAASPSTKKSQTQRWAQCEMFKTCLLNSEALC